MKKLYQKVVQEKLDFFVGLVCLIGLTLMAQKFLYKKIKGTAAVKLYKKISTTMGKIFEKNSSFHVKERTTGKVQFAFSISLLLVLLKFSFWEKDWELSYNSMKF